MAFPGPAIPSHLSRNTLTNSGKNGKTNQWSNCQIRLTAGSGAGQFRTVASNTAGHLTLSNAWSTAPDASSQYSSEGNDDVLYFIGNNAIMLYRYSISANSWSTLSPTNARVAASGAGLSGHWIHLVSASVWTSEASIGNGRYSIPSGVVPVPCLIGTTSQATPGKTPSRTPQQRKPLGQGPHSPTTAIFLICRKTMAVAGFATTSPNPPWIAGPPHSGKDWSQRHSLPPSVTGLHWQLSGGQWGWALRIIPIGGWIASLKPDLGEYGPSHCSSKLNIRQT